jgi:hypothetical protein
MQGELDTRLPVDDPDSTLSALHAALNVTVEELAAGRRELEARIEELEQARRHIRDLQGILPICMYCKRVREHEDDWGRIDEYLESHSDVLVSHGLCPECLDEHFPAPDGDPPRGAE